MERVPLRADPDSNRRGFHVARSDRVAGYAIRNQVGCDGGCRSIGDAASLDFRRCDPAVSGARTFARSGKRMSVTVDRIAKAFGTKPVLNDVSLDVADGEFTVLLG